MKPLPVQPPGDAAGDGAVPLLPVVISAHPAGFSRMNRRIPTPQPASRAYPWMLLFSTLVAALFCTLYITKPVIIQAPAISASPTPPPSTPQPAQPPTETPAVSPEPPPVAKNQPEPTLMPPDASLPGEASDSPPAQPTTTNLREALEPLPVSPFEETNLRIQHVLTAEAPGGHLGRIDVDVPVLYQSRNLRWTTEQVAEARALLVALMDYQEKTTTLRAQGSDLLNAWNRLIESSIPTAELRADSPSLPANQEDAADAPRPASLITTDSIQLQPRGK